MIPSLNLESGLGGQKKKPSEDERKDDVPGFFSPRPSHSRSCSMTGVLAEPHKKAVGAAGESSGPAPSPPKGPGRCEQPRSHFLPGAMLLDHERVRNRSVSSRRVFATARSDDDRGGGTLSDGFCAPLDSVDACGKFALRGTYVSGRPWRCVAGAQRANFRNSSLNISALATSSSGEHVALGDGSGRLLVMRRGDCQNSEVGCDAEDFDTAEKGKVHQASRRASRVCELYEFAAGRQAYTSVIDPLNSVEVTPCIQALCFLPQTGPTTYLLAANEKIPKLYKVIEVQESPAPFLTIDCLEERNVDSLRLNLVGGATKTAMKEVSRYALSHEYNINSICPVADCAQFYSSDDVAVKLWCILYPDASIETYSLKTPFDDEIYETITGIQTFPHEPFLVFIATSAGVVRLVDTRQRLRWLQQAPLEFRNTYCEGHTLFANYLSDCALSPCGRYLAGRDVMSVCLWDVRRPSSRNHDARATPPPPPPLLKQDGVYDVVRRWELYPHLRQDMEQMFQGGAMTRFSVRFLNTHEVCSGGFVNTLYTLDILKDDDDDGVSTDGEGFASRCGDVQALQLPRLEGARGDMTGDSLRPLSWDEVTLPVVDGADTLCNGAVANLSFPLTSANGECCLFASCGQAVFQLTYSNQRC